MHQPSSTLGTEEALRLAIGVRPRVFGDSTGKGREYFEGGEDGGHAVGGRALMAALGAMANEECLWFGKRGGEGDLAALAASFHPC